MSDLTKLPNIGKALAGKLENVEISTPDKLKEIGSKEAFMRIKLVDQEACINMLCALEGAVQGIRWHNLSQEHKNELRCFYESFK